jgi:hypothetical protein
MPKGQTKDGLLRLFILSFNCFCGDEITVRFSVGYRYGVALLEKKNVHTVGYPDIVILALNLQIVNGISVVNRGLDIRYLALYG